MKTILCFTVILFFLGTSTQLAQVPKNYDSVSVFLKNYEKNNFIFNPSLIQSISITQERPKRTSYPASEVAGDIGRVGLDFLFIMLFDEEAVTTVESIEVDWVLSNLINCKDPGDDWNLQIFAKGNQIKDLFFSEKHVWWERGATGIILQQKDTISRFVLFLSPDMDTIIEKMDPGNLENRKIDIMQDFNKTFEQGSLFFWDIDFAIIGEFRGNNFSALASENAGKFWIFKNGKVQAILEQPKKPVFSATKKSEEWSLLIRREDQNDTLDYLRLSMLYYYFRAKF
jgi:hypothetical protein